MSNVFFNCAEAAVKQLQPAGEIRLQLDRMSELDQALGVALSDLADRLAPALAVDTKDEAPCCKKVRSVGCSPIANELHTVNDRLERRVMAIGELIRLLEI